MQPLTSPTWAIFFKGYEPIWTYGEGLTEEITLYIYGLVTSLREFGNKWTGAELTTIAIGDPHHPWINNLTIMIVQAGKDISLVISEPQTTVHLLAREKIPVEVEGALQGVLVGNALQLYSKYYSGIYDQYSNYIDSVFEKSFEAAGLSHKASVKDGHSDFSRLSLSELILFHVHLRMLLERTNPNIQDESWFLVAGKDGTPIPIHLGLLYEEAITLAAFLCTVYTYSQKVFGRPPSLLVFGQDQLTYLYFVSGGRYLCFARQPRILVHDRRLYRSLENLPKEIKDDVKEPLRYFLAEVISREMMETLCKLPIPKMYEKVKRSRLLPSRVSTKPSKYMNRYRAILQRIARMRINQDELPKNVEIMVVGNVSQKLGEIIESHPHPWQIKVRKDLIMNITVNLVQGISADDVTRLVKPASKSAAAVVLFDHDNLQTFVESKVWIINIFAASPKPYLPVLLVGYEFSDDEKESSDNGESYLDGPSSFHSSGKHSPQVRPAQVVTFIMQLEQGIGKKDIVLYRHEKHLADNEQFEKILKTVVVQTILHHLKKL